MTQKTAPEKLISALVQTIDPKEIADEKMRQTVELLLNLISTHAKLITHPLAGKLKLCGSFEVGK